MCENFTFYVVINSSNDLSSRIGRVVFSKGKMTFVKITSYVCITKMYKQKILQFVSCSLFNCVNSYVKIRFFSVI